MRGGQISFLKLQDALPYAAREPVAVGQGMAELVVADGPPVLPAPGHSPEGVAAGGRVAVGLPARVRHPHGAVLGTCWHELVVAVLAVPKAGPPAALGAGGAEEGGLWVDDPHGAEFISGWGLASPAGWQWRPWG